VFEVGGFGAAGLGGCAGASPPSGGCEGIVGAALGGGGRTGVFFNKDEDLEW
jgi:hypothetical protein